MEFKQDNLGEIIESEREMLLTAADRFGDFFINVSEFNDLLNNFLESVDQDRFIFAMFLSQIRKHSTLAIFSTVRLHHVQASLNLRQVLEAGSCAAYAIANIDREDFADFDDNGFLDASQKLTKKRYKWLEENYLDGSTAIYNMKNNINTSSAHSNIIYAHNNFNFDIKAGKFETPFFDMEDEYRVQITLWSIANTIMMLIDLFYGVNRDRNVIKFIDDFIPQLKNLEKENLRLKNILMATDRFKKVGKFPRN